MAPERARRSKEVYVEEESKLSTRCVLRSNLVRILLVQVHQDIIESVTDEPLFAFGLFLDRSSHSIMKNYHLNTLHNQISKALL